MNSIVASIGYILYLTCIFTTPIAFANHDHMDDVEDYEYVLRFDQKDLSKFDSFVIDDGGNEYGEFLTFGKNVGSKRGGGSEKVEDFRLAYSGDIPRIIWGVPSIELTNKISNWCNSDSWSEDGIENRKMPCFHEGVIKAFGENFGRQAIPIEYTRSHVLKNILEISSCHEHFNKPIGGALRQITETVAIKTFETNNQIVPVSYRFEYAGLPDVIISVEQARGMTKADFINLIYVNGVVMTKNEVVTSKSEEQTLNWLWFYGLPAFGAVGLVTLYIRQRRNGK
jgi:hypothetical protein